VSEEPDEATITRRSENAETTMGCLGDALGCAWIASSLVVVVLPLASLLH